MSPKPRKSEEASDLARMKDDYRTDDYMEIPDVFGGQEGDFLAQVKGASFESLAILEGDYLVVRPTPEPEKLALAVAVQGDEDPPSAVICGAEELPLGAKLCGQLIGIIRKV